MSPPPSPRGSQDHFAVRRRRDAARDVRRMLAESVSWRSGPPALGDSPHQQVPCGTIYRRSRVRTRDSPFDSTDTPTSSMRIMPNAPSARTRNRVEGMIRRTGVIPSPGQRLLSKTRWNWKKWYRYGERIVRIKAVRLERFTEDALSEPALALFGPRARPSSTEPALASLRQACRDRTRLIVYSHPSQRRRPARIIWTCC